MFKDKYATSHIAPGVDLCIFGTASDIYRYRYSLESAIIQSATSLASTAIENAELSEQVSDGKDTGG